METPYFKYEWEGKKKSHQVKCYKIKTHFRTSMKGIWIRVDVP